MGYDITTPSRHDDGPIPNPWAGEVECPGCHSSHWTMPYDRPTSKEWRCVKGIHGGCGLWFTVGESEKGALVGAA